ncbi:hypothetical protein VTK56DRAFT_6588 [Thermocarpiscus australiensis]
MAASRFDAPFPGSSLAFDIYDDAQAPRATAPVLPGGPCNYTDRTLPRCGCRRFWSRPLPGGASQDNVASNPAEICMCSHHACFHEDVPPGQAQYLTIANAVGQENQKPRANREPLSPVQDFASFHMPASFGSSLDFNLLDFQAPIPAPRVQAADHSRPEDARAGQDSPMPDTFNSWRDMMHPQAGQPNGIPPIPSQCLMSSQPPSTASSSQARYLRPFAGKGLQTLSGASALRPEARGPDRTNEDNGAEAAQDQGHVSADSTSRPEGSSKPFQDGSAIGVDGVAYQKLADTVEAHEQRLDRLENASFSVAGHEECQDKHEHTDLRVTELESRVEEVEKILNDNGSITGRPTVRHDGAADDATASIVSVSTDATARASNRAEIYSQLQSLQAQVSQLQATALPSYTKPWELEVVFMPFPLKGIWVQARDFPAYRRSTGSNADDWTQMPNTISRSTPDPQSPGFLEWAGQGPESNWLLPRAFPSGRVIDQRLKSRGLIKTVLVRGADARSVQLAIHDAFGDVLRISSTTGARSGYAPEAPLAEFLGLRQSWVPLRKLHKDSRLRFLSPAEMATPALWDFTFLVSSVVMKATGLHRLYITQPEAYLQDHRLGYHAFASGWTWQKLRQLSRVYPDSQSSIGDVPEADAMEECWTWNDRLDEPPSVNTSAMSLRQSHQQRTSRRSSTEPSSQQFYTGVESPILSNGPGFVRGPSPLVQRERKGSWPPHIRTGSLPPVAPALLSPAQSRRRISSHAVGGTPYERRSSPFVPRASPRPSPRLASHPTVAAASAAAIPKRRFTRSPSLVPRNTPRWSRTSMSRSPSLAPGGPFGFPAEERERERRTTPFYYATPHSEAFPEPYGYHRAGSRGPPPPAVLRTNGYDPDEDDEDMNDDDFEDDDQGSSTDPYDSEMTSDANGGRSGKGGGSSQRNGSFGFGMDGDDDEAADLDIDVYEDEDEDELDGVDTDGDNVHDGGGGAAWHGFGRQVCAESQAQQAQQQPHQQQRFLQPEDIPWAGIEDNMSDGENMDPTTTTQSSSPSQEIEIHQDDEDDDDDDVAADLQHRQQRDTTIVDADDVDGHSSSSSSQAPSEYSSRPGPWQIIPLPAADDTEERPAKLLRGEGSSSGSGPGQRDVMVGFQIHEDGTAGAVRGEGEEAVGYAVGV